MGDEPPRQPRFWPTLFISAFVLGTVLWCLWMVNIVHRTRAMRELIYPTPATSTNSGATNAK